MRCHQQQQSGPGSFAQLPGLAYRLLVGSDAGHVGPGGRPFYGGRLNGPRTFGERSVPGLAEEICSTDGEEDWRVQGLGTVHQVWNKSSHDVISKCLKFRTQMDPTCTSQPKKAWPVNKSWCWEPDMHLLGPRKRQEWYCIVYLYISLLVLYNMCCYLLYILYHHIL